MLLPNEVVFLQASLLRVLAPLLAVEYVKLLPVDVCARPEVAQSIVRLERGVPTADDLSCVRNTAHFHDRGSP
jgi:hypothetical protein